MFIPKVQNSLLTDKMVEARTLLLVIITILTAIFIWSRRTYVYWQRRCIKFVKPAHLVGSLKKVVTFEESFALQLKHFYFDKRFENEPLIGIYLFHQPALLLRDLDLVRTVLIEDFVSFSNRFAKCDLRHDKMGSLNLFFVKNPEWREIRTRLMPAFTHAKIKQMFSLMEEIGDDLEGYLKRLTRDLNNNEAVVEIKEICDMYNTDMIASIAFGLRSYSLRSTKSEIGAHCQHMFLLSMKRAFYFCIIFFLPKLIPIIRPRLLSREHEDFLRKTIMNVIAERERSGNSRNDLIELFLTLKKEAELIKDKNHFTNDKDYLPSQAAVFEFAGIQTCSTTMTFALYELANQPAIQQRLRAEILSTIEACQGAITDEIVNSMQYLGMVVDETLRKYPIVPFLERECTPINKKRYYSFRPQVECLARRGMPVYISNLAIHHDPKYWPNPETFDPERFSPAQRRLHRPMSYLPFGAGSRNCIGIAVGQLQVKLGLLHFLHEHRVEICDKTVTSIKFDPKFALLSNLGGIYLKVIQCTSSTS